MFSNKFNTFMNFVWYCSLFPDEQVHWGSLRTMQVGHQNLHKTIKLEINPLQSGVAFL